MVLDFVSDCTCELCDAKHEFSSVDSPDPPSILCIHIQRWISLSEKCCCRIHLDCNRIIDFGMCECPRCHFCIELPSKDPLRCDSCKSKVNRYQVCRHQRGNCGKYGRCTKWREERQKAQKRPNDSSSENVNAKKAKK